MLPISELASLLPTLLVQPFSGILYRAVTRKALVGDPPYPSVRPLFDLGPAQKGARFTPLGGMRSVYLAADPETAIAEVNQAYAKLRLQNPPVMATIPACMIYSATVVLDTILDVADPAVQATLETSEAELCDPTWRVYQSQGGIPLTQMFGQAVFDCGSIQAIRYPSALLPGHMCYVVFTERLTRSAFIQVDDPDGYLKEQLP